MELETAKIILDIYEEEKEEAKLMKVDNDVLLTDSKEIINKHGYIASMIAEGDIVSGARGLLSIVTSIGKINNSIIKEWKKKEPESKRIDALRKIAENKEEKLKRMIENFKFRNELYKRYLNIQ